MHLLVVFLVVLVHGTASGLELLDLLGNACLSLLEGEFGDLEFERLGFPVLRLLRGLEGGVLTDSGVGTGVDLLNVF